MVRTYLYTQIKTSDFNYLKALCKPFTKDIFGAGQEYIIAFEDTEQACRASLQFLNQAAATDHQHPYKIILLLGEFIDSKPQEVTIRIARSIHRRASPRNLYVTNEIVQKLNPDRTTFEEKNAVMIKELQKEIPMFVLTRLAEIELSVDPADLFDFSQVDSYSSVEQPALGVSTPSNTHSSIPKNPFESSNTTLELGTPRNTPQPKVQPVFQSIAVDTGKVNPAVSGKVPATLGKVNPFSLTQPAAPRPSLRPRQNMKMEEDPQSQLKSILIIAVLVTLVTAGGYLYSQRETPKNVFQSTTSQTASNPQIPVTPVPETNSQVTTAVKEAPDAKVGYMNIRSTPSSADVWLDGKKLSAKTPINQWKVVSDHSVTVDVSKSGYQKASKKVMVGPMETSTISFQLNPWRSTKPLSKTPTNKTPSKSKTTSKTSKSKTIEKKK